MVTLKSGVVRLKRGQEQGSKMEDGGSLIVYLDLSGSSLKGVDPDVGR